MFSRSLARRVARLPRPQYQPGLSIQWRVYPRHMSTEATDIGNNRPSGSQGSRNVKITTLLSALLVVGVSATAYGLYVLQLAPCHNITRP